MIRDINILKNIMEMTYGDLKNSILNHVAPSKKLISAERTKFFSTIQQLNESISQFLSNLRHASECCDSESLKRQSMRITLEEDVAKEVDAVEAKGILTYHKSSWSLSCICLIH
ncbi:Hypothetical predicted protein [Octopus vulgaris]|uniref:Uncharacterized protein n=1 Tax=Octopus vulgaris TaxID=6645 RepID=A0AA36BM34_OCTVU|nr:Hypothetical predicted protein [Octopus vulgaris]